jgi:hypothetical protein
MIFFEIVPSGERQQKYEAKPIAQALKKARGVRLA